MSGVLDWGKTYAFLGIPDPVCERRLLWCWVYEDDNGYGALAKGWQGSLGLPRVLSVKIIEGVTDTAGKVNEKAYWDAKQASDGTYTIRVIPSDMTSDNRRWDNNPFQSSQNSVKLQPITRSHLRK